MRVWHYVCRPVQMLSCFHIGNMSVSLPCYTLVWESFGKGCISSSFKMAHFILGSFLLQLKVSVWFCFVFFFFCLNLPCVLPCPLQKSFLSTVFPIVKINEKRGHYDNKVEGEILRTENSPRLMRILTFSPNQSCKQTITDSKHATQNMDSISKRWSTRQLI